MKAMMQAKSRANYHELLSPHRVSRLTTDTGNGNTIAA